MINNFSLCYITYFSFYTFYNEDKILHLNYLYPIYGYDATNQKVKDIFETKYIKSEYPDLIKINNDLSLIVNLYPGDIALYLGYNTNVKINKTYVHEYSKIYYPFSQKLCWVSSDCIFRREANIIIT